MSEVHATEAPVRVLEALEGGRTRSRRRLARRLGLGRVESLPAGITEAAAPAPVLGREGMYRRALALSDMAAATGVLLLVLLLAGDDGLEPAVLAFAPLLVLVNKLTGLYDRDDLVLNKTTLDEAPALLQIGGL